MRDLSGAFGVLKRHPYVVVLVAFGVGFGVGSFCVLPFVAAATLIGLAVRLVIEPKTAGSNARSFLSGAALLAVIGAPALALSAAWVMTHGAALVVRASAMIAGAVLFAVGTAPFVSVGGHLHRRGQGLGDAIGRALAASAVLGAGAIARRGVFVGALLVVPPLGLVSAHAHHREGLVAAMLLSLPPLAMTLVVALTRVWTDEEDAALTGAPTAPVPRALWLAPSLAAGLLAVATGIAVIVPSPAFEPAAPPGLTGCVASVHGEGPHGLTIEPLMRAERIEAYEVRTADGGGAGRVEGPPSANAEVCRREGHYLLRFGDGADAQIDPSGVRLDDGPGPRLRARTRHGVPWLVVVAVLALAGLAMPIGSRLRLAQALGADEVRVVRGRLELHDGAKLANGALQGDATFVGDEVRVRVPTGVSVLGDEGEKALLIAPRPIASLGLREGSAAWPDDALLVLGPPEVLRVTVLSQAARRAAPFVALASLGLTAAAVLVLFQL